MPAALAAAEILPPWRSRRSRRHAGSTAPGAARGPGAPLPAGATADLPLKDAKEKWMQVLEAAYLRDLLERHGGNISAAAKAAGIDRKTFHRLINKSQIRG